MVDISTILHLGKQPITSDAPCGHSIDEADEEFNNLRLEMDKSQKLITTSQSIDWGNILETSTNILRKKSKDIQVAGYLSCALFEKQGYAGMAAALTIFYDLIDKYWQEVFPQRLRGRERAITWMAEKLGRAVSQRGPNKADLEAVQQCEELVKCIDFLLQKKFNGNVLGFGRLYSLLHQFLVGENAGKADLPETALQQKSDSQKIQESAENASQFTEEKARGTDSPQTVAPEARKATPSAQSAELSSPQESALAKSSEPSKSVSAVLPILSSEPETDVEQEVGRCQTTLRQIITFLLRNKLDDPLPYHLVRSGAWLKLTTLPDIAEGKQTKAWNSEQHRAQRFEEDLRNGHYSELIPAVEVTIFDSPFWLDAHYYTVQALEKLGPAYEAAKGMVALRQV